MFEYAIIGEELNDTVSGDDILIVDGCLVVQRNVDGKRVVVMTIAKDNWQFCFIDNEDTRKAIEEGFKVFAQ